MNKERIGAYFLAAAGWFMALTLAIYQAVWLGAIFYYRAVTFYEPRRWIITLEFSLAFFIAIVCLGELIYLCTKLLRESRKL